MPNKNTFEIKPIKSLIDKYSFGKIIDPFANKNKIANVTNGESYKDTRSGFERKSIFELSTPLESQYLELVKNMALRYRKFF